MFHLIDYLGHSYSIKVPYFFSLSFFFIFKCPKTGWNIHDPANHPNPSRKWPGSGSIKPNGRSYSREKTIFTSALFKIGVQPTRKFTLYAPRCVHIPRPAFRDPRNHRLERCNLTEANNSLNLKAFPLEDGDGCKLKREVI